MSICGVAQTQEMYKGPEEWHVNLRRQPEAGDVQGPPRPGAPRPGLPGPLDMVPEGRQAARWRLRVSRGARAH